MSGWGGLGGYFETLQQQRESAGNPDNTGPGANLVRRSCDAVARTGLPPIAAPHAHYVCRPYWDNAPYDPPEDPSPPFQGGQCPGVPYEFRITQVRCNSETEQVGSWVPAGIGPINFSSPSQGEDGGIAGDSECFFWFYTRSNANESFEEFRSGRSAPTFEVRRVDGLPDECGDPTPPSRDPVDVPPSLLPPFGEPVDISDPNDPDDDTPPIVFAPNPPPEYEPFVPFVPSFPGQPPFAFPPGPGDDIPPRVGPESDLPPGGSGSEDVEAPDDSDLPDECVGYAWEFYDIPANRGGIPGADPERFYEIFGSAQLRVSSRDAAVYDAPVKIDSARGVCYRSDKNLRVRGLSLNSKTSFGSVRVRPVYVVVRQE